MTAQRTALLYVGAICFLWGLIPSLFFPNPPLDVVEGYAWGREMALGYTKHPPMQAWLLELSYHLTGGKAYGGYWLSALSIAAAYGFIWALARRVGLTDWQAVWSLVLTSVTFYFTVPVPEFNPNILQIPVWAGMMLIFHRALADNRAIDWILLGAFAAFGLYTKYFVVLLIGTIGLYALVFPAARKVLAKPGPYIAAGTALFLLAPHLYWLIETEFLTFRYAASRSVEAGGLFDHLYNPLNFLAAQIGTHAGLFLVCLLGLGWAGLKNVKAQSDRSRSAVPDADDRRFLLWFAFVPLGVVLIASAVTGNDFKHMWGTPLFVLSGILAVWLLRLPQAFTSPKRALLAAVALQIAVFGAITGQAVVEPYWKTKQTRIHYPGAALAEQLTGIWRTQTGTPLAYVAGDMWTTANVTLFSADRPSMFLHHDLEQSPWIDIADVREKGVLVLWRGADAPPSAQIAAQYPDLERQGVLVVPYQGAEHMPPARVNWAIVPPGTGVNHDPAGGT